MVPGKQEQTKTNLQQTNVEIDSNEEVSGTENEYVDLTDEEERMKGSQRKDFLKKALGPHFQKKIQTSGILYRGGWTPQPVTPKRQREEERPLEELDNIVKKLLENSDKLSKLIVDNTNTKVEIKTEVKDLARTMLALQRKVKDIKSPIKRAKISLKTTLATVSPKKTVLTSSIQTQAEAESIVKETESLNVKNGQEIDEMLENPTLETLQEIIDIPWPNTVCKKVKKLK